MTFVFMCPRCSVTVEQDTRNAPVCRSTKHRGKVVTMLRDYRTEAVNVDRSSLR